MNIAFIIIAVLTIVLAAISLCRSRCWRAVWLFFPVNMGVAALLWLMGQHLLTIAVLCCAVMSLIVLLLLAVHTDGAKMRPVPFRTYGGAAGILAIAFLSWGGFRLAGGSSLWGGVLPAEKPAVRSLILGLFDNSAVFPLLIASGIFLTVALVAAGAVADSGE